MPNTKKMQTGISNKDVAAKYGVLKNFFST